MKQKGDMSINVIIAMLLALIVLITLVVIFREQISNLVNGFTGISKGTIDEANKLPGELFSEDNNAQSNNPASNTPAS